MGAWSLRKSATKNNAIEDNRDASDETQQVSLGGFRLEYRSDWDLLAIVENFYLNVYRLDLLRPGWTVMDIGAGVGEYSLAASKLVGNSGRVIAVEPNPTDFPVLSRNMERNGCSNVVPLNAAIGSQEGRAALVFKGESFQAQTMTVQKALDAANCKTIDFVKMDAEGYESQIIPQAVDALQSVRFVAVELHGDQTRIESLLSHLGFEESTLGRQEATRRLLKYALFHPRLTLSLYRKVRRIPGYSARELGGRVVGGLDMTQTGRLTAALFSRCNTSKGTEAF